MPIRRTGENSRKEHGAKSKEFAKKEALGFLHALCPLRFPSRLFTAHLLPDVAPILRSG
jgi:hypothetical protein